MRCEEADHGDERVHFICSSALGRTSPMGFPRPLQCAGFSPLAQFLRNDFFFEQPIPPATSRS
jgi:hypothetical protein